MTRKKSRPTHRENAATVPSNEGGFYKMFWNSMETNPGTNGPGSPSQGDVSLTSPPVIIIDDSPEGSPCARDDNACENLVVPLPIKEETCEDLGKILAGPSLCENASQNSQKSLSGINGDCASNQTCLPDIPLTSQSINNSPVYAPQTDLNSIEDTPETLNEIDILPCRPLETPSTAEDSVNPVENCQVGEQVTSDEHIEMFPDNSSYVVSTGVGSEDGSNSSFDVVSNLPEHTTISKVEPITEVHAEGTLVTAEYTSEDLSNESPMATDPQVSAEDNEESPIEEPSKTGIPTSTALNFLKSLLEEPNENLENMRTNFAELPALQDSVCEPQNGGDEVECEAVPASPAKGNDIHGDENVTCMEVDLGTTTIGSTLSTDDNMMSSTRPTDESMIENHTNEIVDDEEDLPPDHNFLAKNIKVDSSGISRSLKDFKVSIRALYKAYLKDEFLLKTVNAIEPPLGGAPESAVGVQETPIVPVLDQLTPICSVNLERLPHCIIEKNIITMSDETLKSWKKKSLRDQNEDKFRHLKVWRRGRTLLWRECELAGMDRATYDKQVAYVKKHKLSENSSDDDASGKGSGNDAASRQSDSSEESSSDEEGNENSEETSHFQSASENLFVPSSPLTTSATATDSHSPEDEYIVERTSPNHVPATKTPSALKITIRKTSTSKSDDDREKPADEEVRFPVPAQHFGKSRKVATKRTFRRLSQPAPKPSVTSKTAVSDPKKTKSAEEEDLYDQSLLGTRSYEVENFNLLEKWDIPFEEPTLFRSPRAASRLAQIKTKEALIPARQRQAAQKTSTSLTTSPSAAPSTTSTVAVSKEVRDVVDFLCSKTVEAMLFPESDSGGASEPTKEGLDGKESNTLKPIEVPSKALAPSEETSSNLDESSEISLSETNSTLDASSDFGGSTASLVSEDFVPPKNKSPPKSRRRRRGAQSWGKKKKVKSKGPGELIAVKGSIEGDGNSLKASSSSPVHPSEFPSAEKLIQGKEKADRDVSATQVHSTQVPVVSEGPGQSPRESEDESARQVKEPLQQEGSNQTAFEFPEEEPAPAVPKRISGPKEAVQEEVVQPRLTRSRQPTVQLDPGLLQNIGARKRKPKVDTQVPVSQGEISKKPKQEPPNKSQSDEPVAEQVTNDNLNTQVPEVSEGPGEIVLDRENKRGEENKTETWEPRRLRSRSRGPCKSTAPIISDTSENQPKIGPVQVEQDKQAGRIQAEEQLELESPQSPPPESTDPEPLNIGRVTRSRKRRSGPAYIAVKSTNALPSVCDIVDSIAGHNLPTPSKLFDDSIAKANVSNDPVTVYNVQTPTFDDTIIPPVPTSTSNELVIPVVQKETADDTATIPWKQSSLVNSELEKAACAMNSTVEPAAEVGSESAVENPGAPGQVHELGKLPTVSSELMQQSAPATHSNVVIEGSGKLDTGDSGASSLAVEQPVPDSVGSGRLVVLDTLNNILAVSAPTKELSVSTASPVSLPLLKNEDLSSPHVNVPSSLPPVSSVLATTTVTSTSLPTFPTNTQDISSILPGTFLNSLFTNTINSNLTPYGNDGTSLPDDPDGDLVIDEGDAPEGDARIDVNFWENLTNADLSDTNEDFSDDDNNTDLADKIDKIIKDQIHQDPVPVPSLKSKENTLLDTNQKSHQTGATDGEKNASALNRRDSIDERTGLPNNFIQRLRDPRIRSRLLSHLEDAETNSKAESALVPFLNSLTSNVPASTAAKAQPAEISKSDPRKNVDSVAVQSGFSIPVVDSSPLNLQGPAVPTMVTHPIKVVHSNTVSPGLALDVTQPLVTVGNSLVQVPLIQGENSGGPEQPPDPSKVDFLVPPSDDEEEESIKRRPSKKKKEIDVELMYKSPLEDLQSEARPAYGDRAPRRYADSFPRRKIGEDRQSRWDDRYSRIDGPRDRSRDRRYEERSRSKSRDRRFEERGRSRSRDGRYEERGRSQSRGRFEERGRDRSRSRDRRSFYDRPSADYDPYSCEEREVATHHVDMQTPYSHSPWSAGDRSFSHQPMMAHPLPSPHWQPNYHPDHNHPPHPPIFMPEPPKIDYMETRLINLELLPKTTNLDISPLKKVFSYFDRDSLQLLKIPSPTYDPNDKPETVRMLDPVSQQMIDFTQTPRPTSGLTKSYFDHIAPDFTLGDVIQYHCISPAYLKVRDNDDDSQSSSDEEGELDESKQKMLNLRKSELEHKERFCKQVLDHIQKRESQTVLESRKKRDAAPSVEHHSRTAKSIHGDQEKPTGGLGMKSDPLQNILQNLPLLRDQYSMNQPPLIAPPPPEWNDVDLRMVRAEGEECLSTSRNPSPPKHSVRSRSRSNSPYRSRRSRSPRRRRRARSRSSSPRVHSDMSISPSRSRSRSPPYSHSRSSRRRRSRSRSSERSRSRRSRSPRRSTSISPSRKYSRR